MAGPNHSSNGSEPPPPAPPLPPPSRSGVFQRFIGPLAFSRAPQRLQGTPTALSSSASPRDDSHGEPHARRYSAKDAVYRTGLPIAAVDINELGSHAIVAGRDILRTVKVQDRNIFEELNLRNAVTAYVSTQSLKADEAHKRREFLPAKDVRWSHKQYSHVVATAAQNGRIALYDVSRISSRVELHHLYQHTSQVNKIDFDPHAGYMLLSGSQDRYCRIWDIREPRKPKGYAQFHIRAPVRDVRWCPTDAYQFALCTEDGTVQNWDIRHAQQALMSIRAHEKACYTLAWHPDGRHIVSGSHDKSLKIWDFKLDNRRQKPVFHLRCPAGIMNVAWRPPCWSDEFAERGAWQSTQIATSYTDDDPRLHIWDLRRSLIPFREIVREDKRPTDMLWSSKDLLWTVDGAGIFAQNDVTNAQQPENSLPPGAIDWDVDGSYYAVTEDRTEMRSSSTPDPAALFLNIPLERLSGTEEGTVASRSLTDDEGTDTSFAEYSSRRVSRAASTRSARSQANTPPVHDDHPKILPLDRAVLAKQDMFVNGQIGSMTRLPGIYLPTELVEKVANFYTRPMTAKQRATEPGMILPRLQKAFESNANVCSLLGMHDEANNWATMEAVIIPELKNWADNNRKHRLAKGAEQKAKEEEARRDGALKNTLSPFSRRNHKDKDEKSPSGRSDKVFSNLFRGVTDIQRGGSDSGSHAGSNMTTPRQLPTLTTPVSTAKQADSTWFTLDNAIEPIQPLPPSLTSPSNNHSTTTKVNPHATPLITRKQEDRRAALRDYRATSRQPLSFDQPIASPRTFLKERHDSAESFSMFSASTENSVKGKAVGQLAKQDATPDESPRVGQDSYQWVQKDSYYDSVGRSERSWSDEKSSGQVADFEMDESPSYNFGLDGSTESKPVPSRPVEQKFRETLARSPKSKGGVMEEEASFEPVQEPEINASSTRAELPGDIAAPRWPYINRVIHHLNPFLKVDEEDADRLRLIADDDVSLKSGYQASDFRPIDITTYVPLTPWALSAYPTMCTIIELDAKLGRACSQFSAHLLSHVHPFFFHQSFRTSPTAMDLASMPTQMSEKLQHPAFAHRFIEGIFTSHISHLRNLQLFISAAEVRKLCVEEFEYSMLAGPEAGVRQSQSAGEHLQVDHRKLKSTCSHCKQLMPTKATTVAAIVDLVSCEISALLDKFEKEKNEKPSRALLLHQIYAKTPYEPPLAQP
ncbi:SEA (Seh1-associated) complex subunit [Lithohypha guttulata]|uniref:SEA (Seh1-associated) complex subunit n=1 Tax=Lithohypha guttulata TaxID=1690604 RepID=A0AAN7T6T5_9EURO|nr:SEA (Seh1-associated) complex subunit [Lithohypha guttulata]KAK5091479.1 SEA (Seh1-associated) complex subunit [Lithohypha guttulata]